MTEAQYDSAEEELIGRLQLMRERECGHVEAVLLGSDVEVDSLDDPVVKSVSSERERAKDEYRIYCNLVKPVKYGPRTYDGTTLMLGSIQMGKVATKGDDIHESPPFVSCNLATFIMDYGRFDLVGFLKLQQVVFPTIYKLAVCLSSIRTNEVGCKRFCSTVGYVSCPRRTRLKVRNYECLATLKANIRHIYIDEDWVVTKYQTMEEEKSWNDLETSDDLTVLNLEQNIMAESRGVHRMELFPPSCDVTNAPTVIVIDHL